MFFRSSNYSIKDHTVDPFEIILETEKKISNLAINLENEIIYTQDNFIHKLNKTKKNKSQENISSLKIKNDLIITGDIKGNVKIFSKNILIRSYSEHTNKINALELYEDKILISASDDATIKFHDILESKSFKTFDWLEDRVKSLKICDKLLYIGLLNGMIYVINLETYEKIQEIETKKGINNLEIKNGEIFYTSHNKIYKLKNETNNEINLNLLGSHTKLITKMKILENRIFTISLDGFLKIWSLKGNLISKINFSSPILSFDNSEKIFYFGLETGQICQLGGNLKKEKKKILKNKNLKDYEEEINYKLLEQNINKNTQLEILMKKYEHKAALKYSLENKKFIEIFGVLYFLYQNRKLKNAIFNLEKEYLENLLDFISDNLQIPSLFEIFQEVLNLILSIYEEDFKDDEELFERLEYLSEVVDEECYFQERLIEIYSFLECYK
ncbi:U3 small nucleolar RNA-associated protein 15 (UTP15) [Vairimorpha necatrix]|uniref:U3 small nucleolar RNA-associated protein 15 (UTP15) n=1 Tax=Vairimorpha necatrix TaxID=6039 RepID=A0AAX4J8K5_9MICR